MAKKSIQERERKRVKIALKYKKKKEQIKSELNAIYASYEQNNRTMTADQFARLQEAQKKLQKLPRDASTVRQTRRCRMPGCGRARGVYRKVGLCRVHFRQTVQQAQAPGFRMASW